MPASPRSIRPRHPEDLPACLDVLRGVYQLDGYPSRWPDDVMLWMTKHGRGRAWVALDEHLVVGHIALTTVTPPVDPAVLAETGRSEDGLASIARLFVAPSFRGRGIARDLLGHAVAAATQDGLRCVLDVLAVDVAAIALYERAGWKRVSSRQAWWIDDAGNHPLLHNYVAPHVARSHDASPTLDG